MQHNEIIDTVIDRLTKQGKPARYATPNGFGDCAYYIEQPEGNPPLQCGVGCLLDYETAELVETQARGAGDTDIKSVLLYTEDDYETADDEEPVTYELPDYFYQNVDLLVAIQVIHDEDYDDPNQEWLTETVKKLQELKV